MRTGGLSTGLETETNFYSIRVDKRLGCVTSSPEKFLVGMGGWNCSILFGDGQLGINLSFVME